MSFTESYLLTNHEEKKIPCDFKCRMIDCVFIGRDRHDYYRHNKRMHPKKPQKEERPMTRAQIHNDGQDNADFESHELVLYDNESNDKRVHRRGLNNPLGLVPLEDFNSETLRESMRKHSNNIQHHTLGMLHGWSGLGNMGVAEVSITTYEIRAEELRKMIQDDVLLCVLKSFEFDTSDVSRVRAAPKRLEDRISQLTRQMRPYAFVADQSVPMYLEDSFTDMLLELLSGVHASENEKLHSICMGDISRKTVNFFSRSPLNDKTYWQANTRETSIKKIQTHVRELYKFVIEAVTASLKAACIVSTDEFVWFLDANGLTYILSDGPLRYSPIQTEKNNDAQCFHAQMNNFYAAHMERTVNRDRSVRFDEDSERNERTVVTLTVVDRKEIRECEEEEFPDERRNLANLVETKKAQLLAKLSRFELDSRTCVKFFNESYATCVNTLKTSKNIQVE
jgi:hypothetical protein